MSTSPGTPSPGAQLVAPSSPIAGRPQDGRTGRDPHPVRGDTGHPGPHEPAIPAFPEPRQHPRPTGGHHHRRGRGHAGAHRRRHRPLHRRRLRTGRRHGCPARDDRGRASGHRWRRRPRPGRGYRERRPGDPLPDQCPHRHAGHGLRGEWRGRPPHPRQPRRRLRPPRVPAVRLDSLPRSDLGRVDDDRSSPSPSGCCSAGRPSDATCTRRAAMPRPRAWAACAWTRSGSPRSR